MNSGCGALGPYNHANATIGRAYGLLSQNLQGGLRSRSHLHGRAGQRTSPTRSVTFAENEEDEPLGPLPRAARLRPRREHRRRRSTRGATSGPKGSATPGKTRCRPMLGGQDPYLGSILVHRPDRRAELRRSGASPRSSSSSTGCARTSALPPAHWDNITTRNLMHDIDESGRQPYASYGNAPPTSWSRCSSRRSSTSSWSAASRTVSGARSTAGPSTHDSATTVRPADRVDRRMALDRRSALERSRR